MKPCRNRPKLKVGWKILAKSCGNLVSAIVGVGGGGRIYRVGRWTRPERESGPLCVFRTRQNAVNSMIGSCVRRCLYLPSKEKMVYFRKGDPGIRLERLPPGTRLADAVMLLPEKGRETKRN